MTTVGFGGTYDLADTVMETEPAPDTSHLTMGEVGEDIPNLPSDVSELEPDTSSLALSPEGSDFSDCTPAQAAIPDLDLSAIALAPAGSDTRCARSSGSSN